jgi:DNA helicase-2/ATP-dependent DNA helicase PcrA
VTAAWLEGLNPAQLEAVTYGDGPLLVIAGAGTGKTKTLACRVACLIDRGIDPGRILLLTFTRRAAAEMLDRATAMTGPQTSRVWGGTFHAVANRLLRMYGRSVGLPADFTVMDQGDAADLMNLIRNEMGLGKGKKRFPRKETLVKIYSRTVNGREKLSEVIDEQFPWCDGDIDSIRRIYEIYADRKLQNHVLDYDDLLLYWRLLATESDVADWVGDQFDHVLVDEYQDTNSIQAGILVGMRRSNHNIMVVGDDAQSIYSFRAATIRNILDFREQFPGAHTVTLEQNYRSVEPILDASNAVMDQARERYTKNLWSDRKSEQRPQLITCMEEKEQCRVVTDRILKHHESGIPLQRQAVLFRAGYHSDQLEVELTRRNIPFHKYGGLKFVESAHIKDMVALLRILENPFDQLSWYRVLLLLDGIGPKSARQLMDRLGVLAQSPDADSPSTSEAEETPETPETPESSGFAFPLKRLFQSPPIPPPAGREGFAGLRRALALCCGLKLNDKQAKLSKKAAAQSSEPPQPMPLEIGEAPPLTEQIELVRRFYEPILQQKYENPNIRLRDMEQLAQIAAGYKSRQRFITDLTLDPPSSTSDLAGPPYQDEDWLVLSTIHSSKGCEWDVVHIIHAADGMIPSDMATQDEESIDEERRMFYVAMTRAKDHLYVYFPLRYYHRGRRKGDAHSYAQLTRFITPEVRALFEERGAGVDRGGDDFIAPRRIDTRQQVRDQLRRLMEG